jgi:dienelactone hydrolase
MMNTSNSSKNLPELSIIPECGLVDEKLDIKASGLQPGQVVKICAKSKAALNQDLISCATFQADQNGCVDLANAKPLDGSYDWVDSMGLIWTLKPVNDPNRSRGANSYSLSPMEITFEVKAGDELLASKTVQRLWMANGVQRFVLHEQGLRGVFFLPPGEGPFPAITIVQGSGGGLNENRAAQYASHGYAALALAYFSYEDLPKGLYEIPLEYFETAIHWLQNQPMIDGSRLAITGQSRGGECSLVLGSTFPEYKVVVAYVPSSVSWGGVGAEGNPDRPAWTFRGKPVTYITHRPSEDVEVDDPSKPIPLTPAFLEALEKKEDAQKAAIPVEKINGSVLLISGKDDQMWPSTLFSEMVMERLRQHQFKFTYEHLSYEGAGHAIAVPYIPLSASHAIHPMDGRDYAYGGNPEGASFANSDSWNKVLQFLGRYL